jgi:cysteinyl-tRNA synthetase
MLRRINSFNQPNYAVVVGVHFKPVSSGPQRSQPGQNQRKPTLIFPSRARFLISPRDVHLMGLKLFNTLTRSVQDFAPLDPSGKRVGMYCCGPTVYDFAHIGNWRTFVFADLVRRYLEFRGYEVQHVMNITDVEDKIIRRVRETKTPLREFTGPYETAFLDDLKTLGCHTPHLTPRATEHIPEIIAIIQKLMARGIAYQAADGSVYFSIEKYRGCGCAYGRLVKLNFDEMRTGERVASDEYEKESVADFALWKARVAEDGDVFWPSPWGEGRPGWHIECSAMSMKVLGQSFDLHLGGEDLMFPHHEDEIAQSEGATGQPFVKYWLHGAHLLVEGKKMSKSLGNFFTLRDLKAKNFTGQEIRYSLLQAHYRETFNFTMDGLTGARTALARIRECLGRLDELARGIEATPEPSIIASFEKTLDSDLNVSQAWGVIFGWVREMNRLMASNQMKAQQAAVALATWKRLDSVMGLGQMVQSRISVADQSSKIGLAPWTSILMTGDVLSAPPELNQLMMDREAARKAKDFKRSDQIRDELKAKGWLVEDSPKGPKLKKL